ncbi:MAG: hypothetical protein ACM33B_06130 [Pseudomonadota bacterium]
MRTLAKEIRGTDVHLDHVTALVVRADRDVSIRNGGCGPVRAGGAVTVTQGGCGPVRTDGAVSIRQGGCGPVRAGHVTVAADGVAGVVFSDAVTVEHGGVVQRQLPAAAPRLLGAGAAVGGVVGLLVGAALARR